MVARSSGKKKRPCSACATKTGVAWLEKGDEEIGSMGAVVCWPGGARGQVEFIFFLKVATSSLPISSTCLIKFSEDGYDGNIHVVNITHPLVYR